MDCECLFCSSSTLGSALDLYALYSLHLTHVFPADSQSMVGHAYTLSDMQGSCGLRRISVDGGSAGSVRTLDPNRYKVDARPRIPRKSFIAGDLSFAPEDHFTPEPAFSYRHVADLPSFVALCVLDCLSCRIFTSHHG